MLKKDAIKLILEYYNGLKHELLYFTQNNMNTDYLDGQLCAIRYILINVYGFKQNDDRF